jgi:hypothetical protein
MLFSLDLQGQTRVNQDSLNRPDSILLNSGRYLSVRVVDTSGFAIQIEKLNSKKHRRVEVPRDNIFSIKFGSSGKEVIFYTCDTLLGNEFTVDEVRRFIAGEQDAQRGYRSRGTLAGSFVIGVTAGIIGQVIAIIPPFLYSTLTTPFPVKIRHKSVRNIHNVVSDAYLRGYALTAKHKRTMNSLLWGEIGAAVGLFIHIEIPRR